LNCEACGEEILSTDRLHNHHTNYKLDIKVPVHQKCHIKIHHGKYPKLIPVDRNPDCKKVKIELDYGVVEELKKLKTMPGDTYSTVIEILLKIEKEFNRLYPEEAKRIESEVREKYRLERVRRMQLRKFNN
jgi:hypothetical protein